MSKFVKYPKLLQLGESENKTVFDFPEDEVIIEEKVDGGNGRFRLHPDGFIQFGTRNMELNSPTDPNQSDEAKNYGAFIQYVKSIVKPEDLNPNYVYFGEIMIKHTLNYDWDTTPPFIGFDIGYVVQNIQTDGEEQMVFLNYDMKVAEFERLGLPLINLKFRGKTKELKTEELTSFIEQSAYGGVESEGIVIKNYGRTNKYGRQMFGKVVTSQFKEVNKLAFRAFKKSHDETDRLVKELITPARIRKVILKETTEGGQELSKKLMHCVPHRVIHDAFEENLVYILKDFKEIDMSVLKKQVPRLCLKELEVVILEQVTKC